MWMIAGLFNLAILNCLHCGLVLYWIATSQQYSGCKGRNLYLSVQ